MNVVCLLLYCKSMIFFRDKKIIFDIFLIILAEKMGFEPTHQINDERISNPRQYHYAYFSFCTTGRDRTGTSITEHQILSLAWLPLHHSSILCERAESNCHYLNHNQACYRYTTITMLRSIRPDRQPVPSP